MHLTVILRITGTLLTLFSFSFLLPAAVALFFAETTHTTFFSAFAITLISGLVLWLPLRGKRELRGGDGFLVTALFYLGSVCLVPFLSGLATPYNCHLLTPFLSQFQA